MEGYTTDKGGKHQPRTKGSRKKLSVAPGVIGSLRVRNENPTYFCQLKALVAVGTFMVEESKRIHTRHKREYDRNPMECLVNMALSRRHDSLCVVRESLTVLGKLFLSIETTAVG